jgi:hypothetical protein
MVVNIEILRVSYYCNGVRQALDVRFNLKNLLDFLQSLPIELDVPEKLATECLP